MRNPYIRYPLRSGQCTKNKLFRRIFISFGESWWMKILCSVVLVVPPLVILFAVFFGEAWVSNELAEVNFLYLDTDNDTWGMETRTWNAVGWEYHPKLDSVISNYAVNAEDLMYGTQDDDEGYWATGETRESEIGYWIAGNKNNTENGESYRDIGEWERKIGNGDDNNNNSRNFKRTYEKQKEGNDSLTIGSKKRYIEIWGIQRFPQAKVVSLGIRLYMEGNAYLKLTYYDKHGKKFRSDKTNKKIHGFVGGMCSVILDLPTSAKNIEKIRIDAKLGKSSKTRIVIIDRIVVGFGETREDSLITMYSLIPDNWCILKKRKKMSSLP